MTVEHLTAEAGAFILRDISFHIPDGGYAVMMGRTGAGKSTLLEIICGLRRPSCGTIALGGKDVTHLKPGARGIGYVPQDLALFPTKTVREHFAFALELRRWNRAKIAARVAELADWIGVADLLDRRPRGLSGGEAQRVALGRALSFHPAVLCLDEPLSALDDATREEMHALLRSMRERTGVTTLHVTHHREDARRLADQVFVLADGRLNKEAVTPVSL